MAGAAGCRSFGRAAEWQRPARERVWAGDYRPTWTVACRAFPND